MSEGGADSPTAGSEAISPITADASPNRARKPPAVSDDLVSVDRHGNVRVESGSGAGRAIYWALKNVLLGPAIAQDLPPDPRGQ